MAARDGFTAESRVEQWLFDYLTHKCVSESAQTGDVDDITRRLLEALMLQSVDPDHDRNDVKANLLIVLDCRLQFTDLDINSLLSSESDKLIQSKEVVSEFLNTMYGLRNTLRYLKESFRSKSASLFALCRSCLLHTYVNIIQIIQRLRNSPEPLYDVQELDSWTSTFLKKAEKNADSASRKDARILHACKELSKRNSTVEKDLPNFTEFIALLDTLVKEIHELLGEPKILKLAKTYSRLLSELEKSGNEDLATLNPSSKHSLNKLLSHNNSSSADEKKSTKGKENQTLRKVMSLVQPSRSSERRSRSSSDDSSGSEEIVPSPRKKARSNERSRSPHGKPGVSRVAQKFKDADAAWNPKSLKDLSRKPASHARVKIGPWTPAEEEKFVLSVLRIGVGKWTEVKEDIEALRSSVQLKDKWRNIPKSRIRSIAREHGLPAPTKT